MHKVLQSVYRSPAASAGAGSPLAGRNFSDLLLGDSHGIDLEDLSSVGSQSSVSSPKLPPAPFVEQPPTTTMKH